MLARRFPGHGVISHRLVDVSCRKNAGHDQTSVVAELDCGTRCSQHLSVGRTEPAIAGVTADLDRWLSHPETLAETRMEMAAIRRQVGAVGATGRAAEVGLYPVCLTRLQSNTRHESQS